MTEDAVLLINGLRLNIHNRLFEWHAAMVMVLMSILLSIPRVAMTGAFGILQEWGVSRWMMAVAIGAFGFFRMAALVANGNIKVLGPRIRAWSATAAAQIWFLLLCASLWDAFVLGRVSLGIACYGSLLICELYSVKRATLDVGRS